MLMDSGKYERATTDDTVPDIQLYGAGVKGRPATEGKTQSPRRSRCCCIVIVAIMVVIIAVLTLALALYYGLKSDGATTPQKHVPLKVVSVRSDGLVSGTIKLTVVYHALPDHTVDWAYQEYGPWLIRSAGQLDQKTLDGDIIYECSNYIDVPIQTVNRAFVRLYSGTESISIKFNVTTIVSTWEYTIHQWENKLVNVSSSIEAPKSENLTVPIFMEVDLSANYMGSPDMFFFTLNTSTTPPTFIEEYDSDDGFMRIEVPHNISVSPPSQKQQLQMNVTLMHEIVKYGGVLSIRIPEEIDTNYIEEFKHGIAIDIVQADTKEVVPNGVVGLLDLQEALPFFGNVLPVQCVAMGNPSPDVKILKQLSGNRYEELESEAVIKDRWTRVNVLTLRDKTTQSGNYTCRATSGTMTSSVDIEVFAAEKVAFVDAETRVLESTVDRTVVQCTATGIPTPVLSFRLFYEYGPDMIESGRYQYERNVSNNIASVRMTISPVDVGIHQLYCRGSQMDHYAVFNKLIVLFPDEPNWNRTLYNELIGGDYWYLE